MGEPSSGRCTPAKWSPSGAEWQLPPVHPFTRGGKDVAPIGLARCSTRVATKVARHWARILAKDCV